MKNITISMPEELVRKVRVLAAEAEASMFQFLCQLAAERVADIDEYDLAIRRYLSRKRGGLCLGGQKLPTRDELYDRKVPR